MLRKLRLNGLKADLNSVQELLRQAHNTDDPVGELQYAYREEILKMEIEELEKAIPRSASVTLFFGGKPVLGSKGIAAEFAGGVLEKFQDLVNKTFANTEVGSLGKRGPIPQKENTQLMITELARGSFGFVLDEMSQQSDFFDTTLKLMVDEVARIVEKTGSPNEPDFEAIIESLDPRTLVALKDFFVILDKNEATIRIVDEAWDFILDKDAVHRGRQRTEATSIEEQEDLASGDIMGFLPEHRKFELKRMDGEIIYGSVSKEAAEQFNSGIVVLGRHCQVKLTIRTVKPLNRRPREVYRLLEFMHETGNDI